MAFATAVGSSPSTNTPVSPSTTASLAPPDLPAMTGLPEALASRKAMPNPSTSRLASSRFGKDEHVAGPIVGRQAILGYVAGELDDARHSLAGRDLAKPSFLLARADDQIADIWYDGLHGGKSPDDRVVAFPPLKSRNRQQHAVAIESQLFSNERPVAAGTEAIAVDSGPDDF